mmetsp:Transcript_26121/g.69519  ORF Transcript_26121/g.69519 Transcript_26121/m.69519 type:complete len:438 (+) Transcript_26121:67-1380(+)
MLSKHPALHPGALEHHTHRLRAKRGGQEPANWSPLADPVSAMPPVLAWLYVGHAALRRTLPLALLPVSALLSRLGPLGAVRSAQKFGKVLCQRFGPGARKRPYERLYRKSVNGQCKPHLRACQIHHRVLLFVLLLRLLLRHHRLPTRAELPPHAHATLQDVRGLELRLERLELSHRLHHRRVLVAQPSFLLQRANLRRFGRHRRLKALNVGSHRSGGRAFATIAGHALHFLVLAPLAPSTAATTSNPNLQSLHRRRHAAPLAQNAGYRREHVGGDGRGVGGTAERAQIERNLIVALAVFKYHDRRLLPRVAVASVRVEQRRVAPLLAPSRAAHLEVAFGNRVVERRALVRVEPVRHPARSGALLLGGFSPRDAHHVVDGGSPLPLAIVRRDVLARRAGRFGVGRRGHGDRGRRTEGTRARSADGTADGTAGGAPVER